MAKEPQDTRLQCAGAMQRIIRTKGYRLLLKEWESVKERAFADLVDETLPDSNLSQRRYVYNQICEWTDIPKSIIAEGDTAIAESKIPEPKASFIKRGINFIGRRY